MVTFMSLLGNNFCGYILQNDETHQPLSRKMSIPSSRINPYTMVSCFSLRNGCQFMDIRMDRWRVFLLFLEPPFFSAGTPQLSPSNFSYDFPDFVRKFSNFKILQCTPSQFGRDFRASHRSWFPANLNCAEYMSILSVNLYTCRIHYANSA